MSKYPFIDDFILNHESLQVKYQVQRKGKDKYLEAQYDIADKLIKD